MIYSNLKIVAAIPCFNTESHIGDVVSRAKKYVDQVIVINDGSHDQTEKAAQEAGAKVIRHEKNLGYGEAVNTCFKVARAENADVLVIIDGDGQHNAAEIPSLLKPVLFDGADIVIGSRFLKHENNMPAYRKFGINVITTLWNFGCRIRVTDSQSGFRAYGKKALEKLSVSYKGMGASIETLEQARKAKLCIKEAPISCVYTHSTISGGAIKHGISVALSVLRIRLHK